MPAAITMAAAAAAAGTYLHWGVISISVTNALIILSMVVLFVLALVVPFPRGAQESGAPRVPEQRHEDLS